MTGDLARLLSVQTSVRVCLLIQGVATDSALTMMASFSALVNDIPPLGGPPGGGGGGGVWAYHSADVRKAGWVQASVLRLDICSCRQCKTDHSREDVFRNISKGLVFSNLQIVQLHVCQVVTQALLYPSKECLLHLLLELHLHSP